MHSRRDQNAYTKCRLVFQQVHPGVNWIIGFKKLNVSVERNISSKLYHGYDDIFLGKVSCHWIGKKAFDVEVANRVHLLFCMFSS